MSLLEVFEPPPSLDSMTWNAIEMDGEMKLVDISSTSNIANVDKYPEVSVNRDQTQAASQRENVKSAFVPARRNAWQRAFLAWHEHGCSEALEEIVNSKDEVHRVAVSSASAMLSFLRGYNSLSSSLFPHMKLSSEELISKYAVVAHWYESPIRAFAWHPHITKFAVAHQDDSVHVHFSGSPLTPILKHKLQKNVAHLAWQPLSSSVLAVACQSCILIWHIEPTSLAARPSSGSVQVLQHCGRSPVTQLAWDPSGKLLLSASPVDTTIMAWNVPLESCTPLKHVGGGGVTLLSWSPDGNRVLSATPSPTFRVWNVTNWSNDVWSQLDGRCTSACWSSHGEVLLFAMEDDPEIHAIKFAMHPAILPSTTLSANLASSGPSTAVSIANLSEVTMTLKDGSVDKVGGYVHQMVWNRTSERLAVLFKGSDGRVSPYIAVFKTTVQPVVQILPSGFVRGLLGEVPHHISFQPSFDRGALLTVVWSSGRIGYIPLLFVVQEQITSFHFQSASLKGCPKTQLYTDGLSYA